MTIKSNVIVHLCPEAIVCAGGIGLGPEGLQVLDSVEVWFFGKFLTNVKEFKWTVLDQKLQQVSNATKHHIVRAIVVVVVQS